MNHGLETYYWCSAVDRIYKEELDNDETQFAFIYT